MNTKTKKMKQDEIRLRAENLMYQTKSLIEQCNNSWATEEEAYNSHLKAVEEKMKARSANDFQNLKSKIVNLNS